MTASHTCMCMACFRPLYFTKIEHPSAFEFSQGKGEGATQSGVVLDPAYTDSV